MGTTISGFSFFKTGARTYENALDFINSIVCMIELSFTHSPPKEKIFVEKHYGHMLTKLGYSPKQSPRWGSSSRGRNSTQAVCLQGARAPSVTGVHLVFFVPPR